MMIPLMHAMLLAAALPPAAVDAEPGSSLTLHQWVDGGIYSSGGSGLPSARPSARRK